MSIPLNGFGFQPIPISADIEPNFLAINLFPQVQLSNDTTDYNIVITMPDGSGLFYEGTISSAIGVDNPVVKVTSTKDSATGNLNYSFSEIKK